MQITIEDLKNNLKTLPEEFYGEVNDFVEALKSKNDHNIPEWQKTEVRRRAKYLQENPKSFVSECEMEAYIKKLENEE